MSSSECRRVGLVGLGLMGTEIARRLIDAGWQVWGWDVDAQSRHASHTLGVQVGVDSEQLWTSCSAVILSLPDHDIVAQVLQSAPLQAGQLVIDTTTGAAEASELVADQCAQRGALYVDATISGSSHQVRNGSATVIVGATEAGWLAAHELITVLAPCCFHVGPPGAGARMKLVTNLVLGLNRAALAEGLAFAQRQGLDLGLTLQLLRATPAYSRIMDTKGEKMIHREFAPQARLSQHHKDVRLMLQCAAQHDLSLPLTQTHQTLLEKAEQLGLGDQDNSAIIETYRTPRPTQ